LSADEGIKVPGEGRKQIIIAGLLLGLLVLGLYLRLLYVVRVSLHFDEFMTIWAAKNVLQRGLPLLPTGDLYSHGLLSTYLEALFLRLSGFQEGLLRLPNVALGLVTILLLYRMGGSLYSPIAGLLAAAWLAADPQAVAWSGRARMYALLQLLALAAIYLFYQGGVVQDKARCRYLGLALFIGALLAHTEAALLWPALALALGLERGLRWLVRRENLSLFLWGGVAVGAIFLLSLVGQPGHLETIQEERPFLLLPQKWWGGLRAFAPFFLETWRLPPTILSILGLPFLLRRHGAATRYLVAIFGSIMVVLIFLTGATWRDPRYAFMVLPLFFLLAGAGLQELMVRLLSRFPTGLSPQPSLWVMPLLVVLVVLFTALTGWDATYRQEWGYDLAFRYVQEHRKADDLTLTIIPPASRLYLGRADYYAIQRGYEFYVTEEGGRLVDRWTGAELLNTTTQLERLLREGRRLWLIVDGWRFQSRYDVDFVELVLDQMDLIYEERGAMVFFSEGYRRRPAPAVSQPLAVDFDGRMMLRGYELLADEIDPGGELEATLLWHALDPQKEYVVFLHLVGEDGERVAQDDKEPLRALYPPTFWPPQEVVRDRHRLPLPESAQPGLYRLDLGLYEADTEDRLSILDSKGQVVGDKMTLDFIHLSEGVVAEPSHRLEANLGGTITLLGYDLPQSKVRPGEAFPLTLYWRAEGIIDEDYTVFVHLVGDEDLIWGQEDSQPRHGFYPTSYWDMGDTVVDEHSVSVKPDAPQGEYRLLAGMYLLSTMERLPLLDETGEVISDFISLGEISVGGE
jgi:4-amino-4-deoxy-L-arabinose transferase-like glycosyltransferase